MGRGTIELHECQIGYYPSPLYGDRHTYFEARAPGSHIHIGRNTLINNGSTFIAEKSSITIHDSCLIGSNFQVFDSDFHNLHPARRSAGDHPCRPVVISRNVFIGSGVTVLKGVTIGENSVIGAGSVVTKDIPADCIAAGCPAQPVKTLGSQ